PGDGLGVKVWVAHDAPGAKPFFAHCELWFDHEQIVGFGGSYPRERRENQREGDEGEIGDDEVRGLGKVVRSEIPRVRSVHNGHSGVVLEAPEELTVADVDGV